jgi:hypothetical protein
MAAGAFPNLVSRAANAKGKGYAGGRNASFPSRAG